MTPRLRALRLFRLTWIALLCGVWPFGCRAAELFQNDHLSLHLESHPVFGRTLSGVSSSETGTHFPTGGPLWRLDLHRGDGIAHRTLDPTGPVSVDRRADSGDQVAVLTWSNIPLESAQLRVRVILRLSDDVNRVRARIEVDWPIPHPDWRLTSVQFPVLTLHAPESHAGLPVSKEAAFLVRGWEQGLVYRDPFRTARAQDGTALPGAHPGPHPLQLQAFGGRGLPSVLYLQTTDRVGYRKDFRCLGTGEALELWVEHPAPDWESSGNALSLPYEVHLGVVAVDDELLDDPWLAVGKAYRDWVETEGQLTALAPRHGSGTSRPLASARDRMRGRTFTIHCRDSRAGELAPHDLATRAWSYVDVLDRWQAYLGAPPEEMVGVFARWHAVHRDRDLAQVPAIASRAVTGLTAALSEARGRGYSVVLGTSPIVTGIAEPHFRDLIDPGGSGVHRLEPGQPVRCSEPLPGLVSVLACLGDPRAVESYSQITASLLETHPAAGVYLDAFAGPPVRLCSGGHDGTPHAGGGGAYFHAGRREVLSRLRALPGDPILVSETLDELLIPDLDGVSMLLGRNIAGGAPQGEWVRAVPLWTSVYHAYQPVLGFFADSVTQTLAAAPRSIRNAEAWRYLFTLHFLAGSRLGFADDLRNLAIAPGSLDEPLSDADSLAMEPAQSEAAGHLGQFLRALYREQAPSEAGELLLWGDLESPPIALESGTTWRDEPLLTLLAWAAYRQPTFVPIRLGGSLRDGGRTTAILSSHWTSRVATDAEGWIFVNWTSEAAQLRCRLTPSRELDMAEAEWQVEGPGVVRWEGADLVLSLPPASIQRVELGKRQARLRE